MTLKVVGHRLLVKPKELETKSKGGIVISYGPDEKARRAAVSLGTVVGVGETAWANPALGFGTTAWVPWCGIGDEIYYTKFAADLVDDPNTGETYALINDVDVQVVVTKES
jgi:co-chaperonin GroES (HSP10)